MEVDLLLLALIIVVFVLLILTILFFLWYSGLFVDIEIKTCKPPFKTLEVAYKFARGTYKDCGSLFSEAHSIAPGLRCIGMYYDSSDENEGKRMRYIIGLILNDEGIEVDEPLRKLIQFKGFQITTFPEVEHVVYSSFPHKTQISVVIAVSRVIPKFKDYIREKQLEAYPLIEVCDGKDIVYMSPLSRQEEFVVPEAFVDSEDEKLTADEDFSATEADFDPDSLIESSRVEELASAEIVDSLGDNGHGLANGSEASTESFEELQLDS